MSPVDGFDPFGWIDLFAITPGEYLNYESPALGEIENHDKMRKLLLIMTRTTIPNVKLFKSKV